MKFVWPFPYVDDFLKEYVVVAVMIVAVAFGPRIIWPLGK